MSSGRKWPKFSFLAPGHKVKTFFEILWFYWINLMIVEKIKSCLWKLESGFVTNGLISPLPKALCPNCSKLAFRPQTSNVRVLGSELHKILHQISSYFTILGHSSRQSYEYLLPENCKKPFKNSLFGAISDM